MNMREFFEAILQADTTAKLESAIFAFGNTEGEAVEYVPVGKRPNNRGAIEVATDPGRSLIERVTNAHDAILELEHAVHSGKPICLSPREAAAAWLGVPEKEGLSGLTNRRRQDLAAKTIVRLEPGEGSQSRVVTVADNGIGIDPERLETTILSLNESNKIQKHYLAGTYGQGGSSTFAFSRYTAIISRHHASDQIGFTIVKYEDLPADEYKTGRYAYIVKNRAMLSLPAQPNDISGGTIIRHFGYDLTRYTSPLGPRSVYGILGRILFDPVASIRFENRVHGWNRTIKGARNSLNGAIDDDDQDKGPSLDHNVPLFSVELGDYGAIGIEYWVLTRILSKDGKKQKTKPADNFVDATKPIVLTHNGQNQGEITGRIIKDEADMPFLQTQGRLICHVNCDRLTSNAKRLLFSSTREQSREGFMLERIRQELVGALKADDELVRLNEEAREQSLKEKDEEAHKQMRRQVAKLLKIVGSAVEKIGGSKGKGDDEKVINPRPPKVKPLPITPSEPPTYVKITHDEDKDIRFYAGQRRYLRVETDANSDYHDTDDPSQSKLNIAVGDDLKVFGTSPLKGGRMRIGVECSHSAALGALGSIRVELYRKGLSALSDEREYCVVNSPEPKQQDQKSNFPDFEVIPVAGPEEEDWDNICYDNDTDVKKYASNAIMNSGRLYVYYSEAFPRFKNELRRFEQKNEATANSFRARYETWLAVHALLMHEESETLQVDGADEVATNEMHRQERCRHATIASMVAAQEVQSGSILEDE